MLQQNGPVLRNSGLMLHRTGKLCYGNTGLIIGPTAERTGCLGNTGVLLLYNGPDASAERAACYDRAGLTVL